MDLCQKLDIGNNASVYTICPRTRGTFVSSTNKVLKSLKFFEQKCAAAAVYSFLTDPAKNVQLTILATRDINRPGANEPYKVYLSYNGRLIQVCDISKTQAVITACELGARQLIPFLQGCFGSEIAPEGAVDAWHSREAGGKKRPRVKGGLPVSWHIPEPRLRKCAVSGKGDRGKTEHENCPSKGHRPSFYCREGGITTPCLCPFCREERAYLRAVMPNGKVSIRDTRVVATHYISARQPTRKEIKALLAAYHAGQPPEIFVGGLQLNGLRPALVVEMFERFVSRLPPCCLYGLRAICEKGLSAKTLASIIQALARVPMMPEKPTALAMWFLLRELYEKESNTD